MLATVHSLDEIGLDSAVGMLQDSLNEAGVVIFPTETVYGIAARIDMPGAIQRIFEIKNRPSSKALPVMVHSKHAVYDITESTDERFELLAEAFWPGPLSIVLRKNSQIDRIITGGGDNVAVRVPSHELPLRLLESLPCPLAVSSANISGEIPSCEDIVNTFQVSVDVIITGDTKRYPEPSTVVDISTQVLSILRDGAIERSRIENIIRGISTI